ncbi:unnamed protein product [Sphagnum jensenii]|uniref:Uncharacterized protein n=1 Tax=Sphagnum jensenii TaxID=128206 RepID=A0ABP0WZG7_9BRYO
MNTICGGGGAISWNVQSIAICNSVMEQSLLFFEIPSKLITLMLFVFERRTVLNCRLPLFSIFDLSLICSSSTQACTHNLFHNFFSICDACSLGSGPKKKSFNEISWFEELKCKLGLKVVARKSAFLSPSNPSA